MAQTVRTDDGVAIEYEVYGSGPLAILFLHGWGNAASFWHDLLTNHLDLTGLRCVAASYRGHGGSDKPEHGYTHERFARDMFAVADAVAAERVVLVGFSMAGKFASFMAAMAPERVLGQVLLASCGPRTIPVDRTMLAGWVETAPHPERMREFLLPFIRRPFREELLELYCANVARASRAALEGTNEMWAYTSIEDEVQGVRVPTLVIGSDGDPLLSTDYARSEVQAFFPGARLVILPCGHDIPLEMPTETAWLLQAFLAGIAPSAAAAGTNRLA